jgi:hypothetical protein
MKNRVFDEVDTERAMQVAQGYTAEKDDLHSPHAWVALIARHLGLTVEESAGIDPIKFRTQLIKVAALAVAAVEAFDREHGRSISQHNPGKGW